MLKTTRMFNLTPHAVTFSAAIDGVPQMITLQPEPTLCRVETESHVAGMIDGAVPIQCQTYGEIRNLPEPAPNTVYVVSGLVLHALRIKGDTRTDVIAPATGPRDNAIRNHAGHVVAVSVFNCLQAA